MEKQIQILLVEDEAIIADYMQDCLQNLGYEVIAICKNYEEAIIILSKAEPDIILIDISLKGSKNGIDLGKYVQQNLQVPFIFATSHSDKATIDSAKKTMPYAYLIKPFGEEELYAVIETALVQYGGQQQNGEPDNNDDAENNENLIVINNAIFIKKKGRFIKVAFNDLWYIESNKNYCTIFTSNNSFVLKTSLKSLQDLLPIFFERTHKSYVINLHHLTSFDSTSITLVNKNLPLGKMFLSTLIDKIKIVHG